MVASTAALTSDTAQARFPELVLVLLASRSPLKEGNMFLTLLTKSFSVFEKRFCRFCERILQRVTENLLSKEQRCKIKAKLAE